MDYIHVIEFQEDLAKKYKYKPIPPMFREEALAFYKNNVPERFSLDGANEPLFSPQGLKLCEKYNRIVIGDYGAFVEILPEDIIHTNITVKTGQEYRDFDERYSNRVKYSWLTAKDNSDIKIYFQKKTVDYADYLPGRYYISPYECSFGRVLEKGRDNPSFREKIALWLKKQGVSSDKLLDYYNNLSSVDNKCLVYAIEHDLFPGDLDWWIKLNEVCDLGDGLSFEQFAAVQYNLNLINCTFEELNGRLPVLKEDIQTAVRLGLEELSFPCGIDRFKPAEIRFLLNMSCDDLLRVSHFSKILAGSKGEVLTYNVENLIAAAESHNNENDSKLFSKEIEME